MIAKPLSGCPLVVKLAVSERANLKQEPSYERLSADPGPKPPSGSQCTPVHVPQDPLSSARNYGTHSVRDAAAADRTSGLCRSAADQLDTGKRHFIIQIAAHVTSVN
ncbi:unnamed protein product [Arctogadus glacialis]